MMPTPGALIDLRQGLDSFEDGAVKAHAITGTGVIAALDQALEEGIISLPGIRTQDGRLHFGREIHLTEDDLAEAGKAIGAIRAGYFTLTLEAGITPGEIQTAYLAGASGTYVDAHKSQRAGSNPPLRRADSPGGKHLPRHGTGAGTDTIKTRSDGGSGCWLAGYPYPIRQIEQLLKPVSSELSTGPKGCR